MKIYIELLFMFLIAFVFICWFVWFKLSKRRALKKYKPEEDEGRKGEEHRKELIKRGSTDPIRRFTNAEHSPAGFTQTEGRGIQIATTSSSGGKDSNITRRNKKDRRGIFRKLGRRRRMK